MRAVLQNYVSRVPVIGDKPSIADLMTLEVNGFLTATYPRINMEFLRWRRDNLPQFAIFKPQAERCVIGNDAHFGGGHSGREWGHGYCEVLKGGRYILPQTFRDQFTDILARFGPSVQFISTTYSGLMTTKVREEVAAFQKSDIDAQVWIVAEVEPSSWRIEEVAYEDPLVVITRGNLSWLLGWYDLTAGEDHVLGTMTG